MCSETDVVHKNILLIMKIDYAIMSSDESHYLDYWPLVSKVWQRFGIKPVLIKITKDEYSFYDNDVILINLPLLPNIKSSLQAQIARIWAFKILNGNCIISDIDMMPLSESYFKDIANQYDEDKIVSYCSDAAQKFDGNHPMCYILANNKVMSELIKYDTWEQFVIDLAERCGQGWSTDQWYLTQLLNSYNNTISLKRGFNSNGQAHNRLDRDGWKYNADFITAGLVYDAHLPKPYKQNEKLIKDLYNLL